jgi:hypothetical protein
MLDFRLALRRLWEVGMARLGGSGRSTWAAAGQLVCVT